MICPSDFILLSQKNKCTCQKSETRFLSRTCQEANAMFIVLLRSFLAGLELNLHSQMLSLTYAVSYDFEIFKLSENVRFVGVYKKNESSTAIRAWTVLSEVWLIP